MVRRRVHCIWPAWSWLLVAFLAFSPIVCGDQSSAERAAFQEVIRVNVSTQHDSQLIMKQVLFTISYDGGLVRLNGFPLINGVSRVSCKMDTMDFDSPDQQSNMVHEALVTIRLRISYLSPNSSTGETKIIAQQQVVEIDGNQVYQNVTTEIQLIVGNNMELLQHMMSDVMLKDTLLYSIPRTSDVSFILPNIPQDADDSVPQETTREYNVRQNTTVDEDPFPGKLPETPLQAVIPSSSYKVMCQFADELRDKLCLIWNWLYPVLVNLIEVFIVGVIAAALVLELLKLIFPPREERGILQPSDIKDSDLFVPLMLSHDEVTLKTQKAGSL